MEAIEVLEAVVIAALGVPGDGGLPEVRFREATAASGIVHTHHDGDPVPPLLPGQNARFGAGAAVADYDNDGDHDVYVCDSYGWPNRLFRNDGGVFVDVTEAAGVGDLGFAHMALFLDLDNDGHRDLFVLNDCSPFDASFPCSQLFRNRGDGAFENVTAGSGVGPLEPTIGGATAGDYDGDGDLDLFVTGWFGYTTSLYRNDGGFRFTDVTDTAGTRPPGERFQWTPVMADFDDDGALDIFCAVDFDEDYLFRNNGDGTFTDVSEAAGTLHVANDMGVAVADLDGDLDLDLYTTNITGKDGGCSTPGGCNMFYRNDGTGRFTDGTARAGIGDTAWGWGVWAFDADLDGHRDLYAVNGWTQPPWHTPAVFFHADGTGGFVDASEPSGLAHVGNTRSLVPIDLEGDGDTDFLVFDVLGPVTVYRNDTPRGENHWLIVEAIGRRSNRDGVGARIEVTAGGRTQLGVITVGGSFYAGPPLESHFGLGPAATVDRLEVRFPSGRVAVLTEIAADQRVRVIEPCPADLDGSGLVGFGDLLTLLAAWGGCGGCSADLDGDGMVGPDDLARLLADWGSC